MKIVVIVAYIGAYTPIVRKIEIKKVTVTFLLLYELTVNRAILAKIPYRAIIILSLINAEKLFMLSPTIVRKELEFTLFEFMPSPTIV